MNHIAKTPRVIPRVTLLMPVRNAMPWLPDAVDSILRQSFSNFLLYAIDDGSEDGSVEFLHSLVDPRVHVMSAGSHSGLGKVLNYGLELTETEFVARMDGDDICTPDRLALQVALLDRSPEIGAVGTQFTYLGVDGRTGFGRKLPIVHSEIWSDLRRGELALIHASLMMRTELVQRIGGYRFDGVGEDWDMFLRFGEIAEFANLPNRCYFYRVHNNNVSLRQRRFTQLRIRYACRCAEARAVQTREPSEVEFLRELDAMPRPAKLRGRLDDLSLAFYVNGRNRVLQGQPAVGYGALALASLVGPWRTLSRLRWLSRTRIARVSSSASGSKPLRVAMVGARGVPAAYSGVERVVEEIGKRLAASGHEVTVFCMRGRYRTRPGSFEGMRLRWLPSVAGKHTEMLFHAAISGIAAAFGPYDVVHFHACGPSLFAWLPRLAGKPTVATLHGPDWGAAKWGRLAATVLRAGEWSACRLASKPICVSRTNQIDLKLRLGVEVECLTNGIDRLTRIPLREAIERFDLAANEYITFVGRLTGAKNVHHLIEAFRQTETNKKLVIVGGGSADPAYVARLRGLAQNDGRIVFTGALYGDMLAQICANAYMFCLPSAQEGMSVALLEALSFGVPVLVSDIAANREVIEADGEPCGLTFVAGSAESLRATLRYALDWPEKLAAFPARGQALVAKHYSWNRAVLETERVYRTLIRRCREPEGTAVRAPRRSDQEIVSQTGSDSREFRG